MKFKDKYREFCLKQPTCDNCPLKEYLEDVPNFCDDSFEIGRLIDIIEGN